MEGLLLNQNRQARRAVERAARRHGIGPFRVHCDHAEQFGRARELLLSGKTYEDQVEGVQTLRRLVAESSAPGGCMCVRGIAVEALGVALHSGRGAEKDPEEGARLFRVAADLGEVGAMFDLGLAYAGGAGVPHSFREAARWYQQAADKGNANAQTNLGAMYMAARGLPQNFEKGLALLRQAAEQNQGVALHLLSAAYEHGTGVEIDLVESARLLQRAANTGDSTAQSSLGNAFLQGKVLKQNFEQARRYYEMSAAQGNRIAFTMLAKVYQEGLGVEKDVATAKYFLKRARMPVTKKEAEGVSTKGEDSGFTHFANGTAASETAAESLREVRQTCKWCDKRGENLRECGGCRGPRYCDAKCQRFDWPEHKKVCDKAGTARANRKLAIGVSGMREDELAKLSINELKAVLSAANGDSSSAIEKIDLVEMVKTTVNLVV
jgi:TPR repeat protein